MSEKWYTFDLNEISAQLKKKLQKKVPPRIVKIVLNKGLGKSATNKKTLDMAIEDMTVIAGQKAVQTKARRSNAGFGTREGWSLGCKVTLRRQRMYAFWDRLLNVAIPRIRDFRGLSIKSFDKQWNYNFGVSDQTVFTEIKHDEISGLDITIVTTARTQEEAFALFSAFKFPFRNSTKEQ